MAASEVSTEALQEAIRNQHGCDSTWVEAVLLKKSFLGQTAWEGTVQVFDLIGHRMASRCYAWSEATTGKKGRFVTVLHQGRVDSPENAVMAAIVSERLQLRGDPE